MEFRKRTLSFDAANGSGPQVQTIAETFPRNVTKATAGLTGFSSGYDEQKNRPFGELQFNTETSFEGDSVQVEVSYGLRDWSGTWDDAYKGLVEIIILADLAEVEAGPMREDLQVVDMEFNQATQFFRSSKHLNALNVQPDNAIPLVAGKTMGVRVYVDYDKNSGLPEIADLTGELEIVTSSETIVLAPDSSITPRRDNEINRGVTGHTLNFIVEGQYCRGNVTFRCRVFDEDDETQTSTTVERTMGFTTFQPLKVFLVAFHYTGQGKNLAPLTLPEFQDTMWFSERTFPVPGVTVTGRAIVDDFDRDMEDIGNLDEANKIVRDLKGDSEDVFVGVFPNGVTFGGPTGQQTRGVASSENNTVTIAHEIGHILGRRHAPCAMPSACDNPDYLDDEYPQYASFARHSIGEFGFDTLTDDGNRRVKSPSNNYDFMGYALVNRWISPYTYVALMEPGDPVSGNAAQAASAPGSRGGGPWRPRRSMMLFLDMSIDHCRRVIRRTSFHFEALTSGRKGQPSRFRLEFLDECHKVLGCHKLHEDLPPCTRSCCTQTFYERLIFPEDAHWLVVYDDKDKIYEECIPPVPQMSIDCNYDQANNVFKINWLAQTQQADSDDIWYLVHWQDVDGSWRGLVPRTQERAATIHPRLFGTRTQMRVRVLASSGIATGEIECLLTLPDPRPAVAIVSVAVLSSGHARAVVHDDAGRQLSSPGIIWFDETGRQLASGNVLDIRRIGAAAQVRAVATNFTSRTVEQPAILTIDRATGRPKFAVLSQPDDKNYTKEAK